MTPTECPKSRISLYVNSFRYLFTDARAQRRTVEIITTVLSAALTIGFVFSVMSLAVGLTFLGVFVVTFGLYMGLSFATNHIGMTMFERDSKVDFLRKQVLGSRNVRGGWFATIALGGLNLQTEHHLFPSMPRPSLLKARQMVVDYCKAHAVVYTEMSFGGAIRDVIRYMNRVGLFAPRPFECPVVQQYRSG